MITLPQLALGSSVTINFQAKVSQYLNYNIIVPNNVSLAYLSTATTYYPRPYASASSTVSITTALPTSSISYSSDVHGASPASLSYGEYLTINTLVSLPAGYAPNVTISSNLNYLSSGLFQVINSSVLFGSNVNSSSHSTNTPAYLLDKNNDGYYDSITWQLSNVYSASSTTINSNPSSNAGALQILFTSTVYVVATNNGKPVSTTTNFYLGSSNMATYTKSFNLVEPTLLLASSRNTTTAQGGDAILFTLAISHSSVSTNDAFAIIVTAPLLPNWYIVTGTVQVNAAVYNVVSGSSLYVTIPR